MRKLNYAIVFVSDMSKSVAFYRDTLGLPLKFESPQWTEFSNEGSTLALHPADSPKREGASPSPTQAGAAVGAGLAPARNSAGTAQLGFHVDNLDDWHKKLTAAGVRCLLEPRAEAYGIRQAVYADPDGLHFTLAESSR